MSRPSALPPEEKTRLVLSVLAGEMSVAEAARRVLTSSSASAPGSVGSHEIGDSCVKT